MRTNTINVIILMLLFSLISCDDDFLDVKNPNDLSADNFWQTEDDLQKGLVATYGALQLNGLLGGQSAVQHPVRSDLGRPNNWNDNAKSLNTLAFNDNTNIVRLRWRDSYIGIYRANQVLANIDNIELTDQTRLHIEAEARFLRAFFTMLYTEVIIMEVLSYILQYPKCEVIFIKPLLLLKRCSR